MRRLTIGTFLSLDGVMQAPGGETEDPSGGFAHGGWLVPHFDAAAGAFMGRMFSNDFELILGRRTYEIFAGHWPGQAGDPFADRLNAMAKHVVTHHDAGLDWANSHRLADIGAVADLKDTDGPDLIVQGSGTLYAPLIAAGLVDRVFLVTAPVILGTGRRAFAGRAAKALRLVETARSPTGILMSIFDTAGPVGTGTFGRI